MRIPAHTLLAGVAAAMLVLIAATPAPAVPNRTLAPGDEVPELRGRTAEGERVVVDFTNGKYTLVNYWATWCVPCKDEMPTLEGLQQKYPDQLQIIGVVKDPIDNEGLLAFLEALEVTYTNIRPQKRYDVNWAASGSLPTSFLIDPQGKVLRRYVGATPEQTAGLVYDVESVLGGGPLGPYIFPPEKVEKPEKPETEAKAEASK